MLVLTMFMKEPHKVLKSTLIGIGIVIPVYTLIVLLTIGALTWDETVTITWPLMSLAKSVDIPGGFFERFESLLSVLWVIKNFTAFVPNYFCACRGLEELFRKDYRRFILFGLLPLIYLIAIVPANMNSVLQLGKFLGYAAIFVVFFMPGFLLTIAKVRRKGIETS